MSDLPSLTTSAERPRLRPGDFAPIEVPWTIDLPAPHREGTLIDHFTLEQCTILCEAIEQSRHLGERQLCRLVDLAGKLWLAHINPDSEDRGAHVQWRTTRVRPK
jgi:hypothetical protein